MTNQNEHQSPSRLELQLREKRRTVDFDTFDIHIQQLLSMVDKKQIKIAPAYQRHFRWDAKRCSQLVESLMLGIPVPTLFMATNANSTWEVVDGVQRLSTIVKFAGDEKIIKDSGLKEPLRLADLQKLTEFDGLTFHEMPPNLQLHFLTRPVKVVTLNDKSDAIVRLDLFERLNTGGIALSSQEIRDCVYTGPFASLLDRLSVEPDFRKVVKLTPLQQRDATAEECVLRFFAFRDRYKDFDHNVTEFLNSYMAAASQNFDYEANESIFRRTFAELARIFPSGIHRPARKGTTSLILYEGIAVGASLALKKAPKLRADHINKWMSSQYLRNVTTGATNNRAAVEGRIEFCRDRFLGKVYVSSTST